MPAGGPVEEIRLGDVVWFPPGEKHWHGASPTTAMTHIAIQERLDGEGGRLAGARDRRPIPRVSPRLGEPEADTNIERQALKVIIVLWPWSKRDWGCLT
jgi:hypothetical protein